MNGKKNSNKFNKYSIFENQRNYDGEKFLKKYNFQYIECEKNKDRKLIENIIWADDANISRISESKNWLIDATYHHPTEFSKILIIYYQDIISKEKYPSFFILMNNKIYENYINIFESVKLFITQNNTLSYNVETITSDSEEALMLGIKESFPQAQRKECYYHYMNDLWRNLKVYNLTKDKTF